MLLMCPLYTDSVICCDVAILKMCVVPAFGEHIVQWDMHTCKYTVMIQNDTSTYGEAPTGGVGWGHGNFPGRSNM